jgi:ribosomal peptide maturation radical SAM protein 1
MVRTRLPEVGVAAHPFYLKLAATIGYRRYHAISERTWLSESVYAALLYPERQGPIAALFRREASAQKELRGLDFDALLAQVRDATEDWVRQNDWGRFGLVGVSIVFCQLTAGLYFSRRLKERHPSLTIVAGGSAIGADSAAAALEHFPQIDAVVFGEGELPLLHLVQHHVLEGRGIEDVPPAQGILTRPSPPRKPAASKFFQLENMDNLPVPDFADYFQMLQALDPGSRFFPTLPVEVSRGCWWQRAGGKGRPRGCAFCNLNRQWCGYRAKSTGRAVAEIDALARRHKTLSLALVDNVLPRDSAVEIMNGLAGLGRDFSLFAEIRATTPRQELEQMAAAGMRTVQIGIEALSTRLLRRLGKGTTAIQNLEVMKHCEALGIANLANIIAHFPGTDEAEIGETLAAIDCARVFRPLKIVDFWLGLDSPVFGEPTKYGIRSVGNHPKWRVLFPRAVTDGFPFVIQGYRGDLRRQQRLWRPVRLKVAEWQKSYAQLHAGGPTEPILSYRDGGDFLIIRERRPNGEFGSHRLEGLSRRLYLFCEKHRSLRQILEHFPAIGTESATAFLKRMAGERLMFAEGGRYLSLAVPARVRRVPQSGRGPGT